MATYTTTRVLTRPNTSTQWPWEVPGVLGSLWRGTKNSITDNLSADELTLTQTVVWATKDQYSLNDVDSRNDDLAAKLVEWRNYMAANNISGRITEEDGTVRVFNSSSKTYEAEQKLK